MTWTQAYVEMLKAEEARTIQSFIQFCLDEDAANGYPIGRSILWDSGLMRSVGVVRSPFLDHSVTNNPTYLS